jgi:fructokinase
MSNLKIERTVAGGSVANSIVGLSQLKNEVSFIGKVNDDKLGNDYTYGTIGEDEAHFKEHW